MGSGVKKIEESETLRAVQTQARRVWRSAWLFALGLTVLALILKLTIKATI